MGEEHYHKVASGNLLFTFFINLFFNIIVIIGSFITGSIAILSDSLHDLNDSFSIFLAWVLERLSLKPSNDSYTYGYERFSILGAIITSSSVIIISIFIISEAISRLFIQSSPDAKGMFIIAIFGIIFKGIAVYKLHGGITFNEKAILFHLLADIFQWIAILVISLIMIFVNIPILDPIISIIISLWLIYNLGKTLINSFKVLLQKIPPGFKYNDFKKDILMIDNIKSIENLHLWSLDGIDSILTIKIILNYNNLANQKITKEKIKSISKKYNISNSTIEFINN